MSIVLFTDILDYLELTADDSFGNVAKTHNGAEAFVKHYTGRDFEVLTYTEEVYQNDTESLWLKQTPVINITRLSVGSVEAMQIVNTNQFSTAVINSDATGLTLTYNGVDTAGDFTFATNATMSAMAIAINAAGDGWVSTVSNDYDSYQSADIIPIFGESSINNQIVNINVPSPGESGIQLDRATGEVMRWGTFQSQRDERHDSEFIPSYRNVYSGSTYVTYKAGYSPMPIDIQLAIMQLVSFMYGKLTNNEIGVKSLSIAGFSKSFEGIGNAVMPNDVQLTLNLYKKLRV